MEAFEVVLNGRLFYISKGDWLLRRRNGTLILAACNLGKGRKVWFVPVRLIPKEKKLVPARTRHVVNGKSLQVNITEIDWDGVLLNKEINTGNNPTILTETKIW